MSSILGAIEIQMLADLARLKQDMDQAKNLVGNASKEMQRMADLAKTALGAIGVGLSVGAFVNWMKSAIDAGDATKAFGQKTGVAAKDVAGLQLAFKQGGVDGDGLTAALGKMSKQVGEGSKSLDLMGVKTRNADGSMRSIKDVLYDTADAVAGMKDGIAKQNLVLDVFGKSGLALIPTLNEGSQGMREMADMAEKLGLVINEETADAADKFNDTTELLGMGLQGVARQVMAQLLPTLNALAGSFLQSVTSGDALKNTADVLAAGLKILYTVGIGIVTAFSTVGKTLGAAGAQMVAILRGDFGDAVAIGKQWKADIENDWTSAAASIESAWSGSAASSTEAMAALVKGQREVTIRTKEQEEAAKKTADAETKRAEEVRKLTSSLDGKIAAQMLELEQGAKLTGAQKEALDILGKLRDGTLKLTEAETLNLAKKLEALLAGEQDLAQKAEAAKASQAMTEWQTKWATEQDKTTESLRSQVASQIAANDELRLGRDAIEQREAAQMRATATDLDWQAANEGGNAVLEEQARLLRQRADLAQEGVALKEAKAVKEEWQRTVDSIGQGLTDSLFRAFESGKDFFSTFWGGVKNLFKTTVLKMMIQPVQGAISGVVGSLFSGMSSAGQVAGGASGAGNILSSLGSLASIGSALGTFGTAASYGASALFGGTGLTALSGGASMVGAGSMAGGLGMITGVLGPIALGLFAVSALMKNKSAKLGYAGGTFGAGGSFNPASGRMLEFGRGDDYASALQQDYSGVLAETLSNTAANFGGSVGSGLGLFVGSDNDRKGLSAGTVQFLRNGRSVGGVQTGGTNPINQVASKIGVDDLNAWFENATSAALIAGLQQSNLPAKFAEYFGTIDAFSLKKDDADAILATASGVLQLTEALGPLGGVFSQISGLSVKATQEMVNLAGGFEAFNSKAQSYVKAFYSEDEQLSLAASQLRSQLSGAGINADALGSREQYRALVDSLDLSGAAGREQLAALLNNAEAFAAISEALGGRTLADLAALAPTGGLFGSGVDVATQTAQASQASAQLLQLSNEHLSSIATSGQDTVTELRALVRVQSEANLKLLDRLDTMSAGLAESTRPAMLAELAGP